MFNYINWKIRMIPFDQKDDLIKRQISASNGFEVMFLQSLQRIRNSSITREIHDLYARY